MSERAIARIRLLAPSEVEAMAALEQAAWSGGLQAGVDTIRRRLALGHIMMVAEAADGRLRVRRSCPSGSTRRRSPL